MYNVGQGEKIMYMHAKTNTAAKMKSSDKTTCEAGVKSDTSLTASVNEPRRIMAFIFCT